MGLSPGAAAGVGVGAGVAGLVLLVLMAACCRALMRRRYSHARFVRA